MSRRILIELATIMRPRDNLAVAHHYGSDGHLAAAAARASASASRMNFSSISVIVIVRLPCCKFKTMLSLRLTERWQSG